jgi:amidase
VSLSGEPLIADMAPDKEHEVQEPKEGASAYALWQLHKKKLAIREAYLKAWNATVEKTKTGRSIDALLVPNGACVAVPHGENRSVMMFVTLP